VKKHDLIIVGAGPAGSSAAKVASQKGLKTIVLEKRTVIGTPRQCEGRLVATTRSRLTEEIIESMPKRVVLTEIRARRVFSPSGKLIKEIPLKGTGARLILRDLFDLELARQAANSGAQIVLNTRVTGLLKENGKIVGVRTTSSVLPEVYGKLVISAGGLAALAGGIPKQEGLTRQNQIVLGGILWELTNVKDIEPDIIEWHTGSFSERGHTHFFPQDHVSVVMETRTVSDLETIKRGNWLISNKIKNAIPLRMTGWTTVLGVGTGLPKYVKDGLILIGSAAGFLGIESAVYSGLKAGEVAAEVIEQDDVSEKKMSKYETLVKKLIYGRGEILRRFYRLSDEQIESILSELVERDELQFWDTVPF
jgi:digeranylgeranylglycerophospholipid reductase